MIVGTGDQQKTWYLPKKVLTRCSPFFDAALNGKFVEASSKVINLPEDNPIAFEIWVTWLSLGKCKDLFGTDYDNDYVRAWTLGDKLACPAFQDHVMFQFLSWWVSGEGLYLDTIKLAYEVSSPGSKLRHLFIDWFAWNKRNGSLRQELDEYVTFLREQTEFSEDVVVREVEAGSNIGRSPFKEKHRYYENPAFDPDD